MRPERQLVETFTAAVQAYASADRTRVDYLSLQHSPHYGELVAALDDLGDQNLIMPKSDSERVALLLNFHNAMVIEAVIELGVRRTVRDVRRFERLVFRRLGPHSLSLLDLRYGVLGNNRRPPYALRRPFRRGDLRRRLAGETPIDPRVRLALTDATRSGPPLAVYEGDSLTAQLQQVASIFINQGGGVIGCPGAGKVSLSPLFAWHASEFGGPRGVNAFIVEHVENEAFAQSLRSGELKVGIHPYDWGLNKSVLPIDEQTLGANPLEIP